MSNQTIIDIINKFPKPDYLHNKMTDINYAVIEACRLNKIKTAEILLNEGANVNIIYNNIVSYGICSFLLNTKIITFLLNKGVNVNLQNNSGDTALHIIFRSGWYITEKRLKHFINYGANLNIKNNSGNTPLMEIFSIKTYSHFREIVPKNIKKANLLVDSGASIKIQNLKGETALMLVVKYSSDKKEELDFLEKLIDLDPSQLLITDNKGKKAIKYTKDTSIKELLRSKEKEYKLYMIYKKEMIYPYLKNILYDDIAKFILSYLF